MANKEKLKKLLAKLNSLQNKDVLSSEIGSLTDAIIAEEVSNITAKLKESSTLKTLQKFSAELTKFKKDFDLQPITDAIKELDTKTKRNQDTALGELRQKFQEIKESIPSLIESTKFNPNSLIKDITSLREQFDKKQDFDPIPLQKELQKLKAELEIFRIEGDAIDATDKERIEAKIEDLRKDLIRRTSNLGGGAPNQRIQVEGTTMSAKYADFNLKAGANAAITAVDNNTTKQVDITITGTGSGITQLTGDVTAGPGSGSQAATLATVNADIGSFGSSTSIPSLTVNAKGLITAASGNVVVAPAGTLTGTTLASNVVTSSITTLGSDASLPGNPTTTTQAQADNSTRIATTAYVDNAILQTNYKEAVKYGSVAALPTVVYANGSSGVGATLTGVALAAISLDGASPGVADRVLIKNQVSDFQNGIYVVTQTGSGIAVFILTRATDFNQSADIRTGDTTFVTAGNTLANTLWSYTGIDSPTMGTTALPFVQVSADLIVGQSVLLSGTSTRILYDNAGVLGEYTLTGTGTVVAMQTAPTFATSITGSYLTASEVLITDGSKNIVSAAVATYPSLTELTYVKGLTSAAQTQITARALTATTITVAGTANQITSSAGAQDLSANRTWTLSLPADVIIPTVITAPNGGLHILDTNASHDLIITPGSDLSADRVLTLTTGDAARTITLSGNPTLNDWFDQAVKAGSSPTFVNLTITSFAANWTNAGRTVADLGTVTTADINGGTLDGTIIGGASAAAATVTTLTATTINAFTTGGAITLAENTSVALDPAGSADGKYTGITVTGTSGYSQAFGDLVTLDKDDSRWEAVDISVAAAATGDARGMMGMVVVTGTDGNACTVLLCGIIRADANFPALTIGAAVYASTTGDIVVTQPSTTDHVIRIVGSALTADEIYFSPDNTWITHT